MLLITALHHIKMQDMSSVGFVLSTRINKKNYLHSSFYCKWDGIRLNDIALDYISSSATYHLPEFWWELGGCLGQAPYQCRPSPTQNTRSTSPGPPARSCCYQHWSLTPGGAPCPSLWKTDIAGCSPLPFYGGCLWVGPPSSHWCWWSWGCANKHPGEGMMGLMEGKMEDNTVKTQKCVESHR